MTLLTILAVLLVGVMFWVYKAGKKVSQFEQARDSIRKVGNVNEFNRQEDIDAERQVRNAGDNPVGGPWNRMRGE
jgi:hypothetical protein|tara:strand:+ start:712 stop:936 length:225 start_codon:yes stop_codon:yes gene_type:complete